MQKANENGGKWRNVAERGAMGPPEGICNALLDTPLFQSIPACYGRDTEFKRDPGLPSTTIGRHLCCVPSVEDAQFRHFSPI
jgi:hypothetical protein